MYSNLSLKKQTGNTVEIAQQIFSRYIRMGHLPEVQIRHHAHSDPTLEDGPTLYARNTGADYVPQTRTLQTAKRKLSPRRLS